MSGHSHFATIKRQKESKDAAKGKIFSKLVRGIQIAVKSGGSSDPDSNYKLRMAIEYAKSENMPKENIDRAITKATSDAQNLEEVIYEGFGPSGVGVVIEAATDNRNRTSQEIKNIFERGGGSLAGPGSVTFNFVQKGLVVIKKQSDYEKQMLSLIDAGAEDVEEVGDEVEVYIKPQDLSGLKENILNLGYEVVTSSLTLKPLNLIKIGTETEARKILKLLDNIDNHDDVQKVYSNIDIPNDIVGNIASL